MKILDQISSDERDEILSGSVPGVRTIGRLSGSLADEALAELIERHAEARLSSGMTVDLQSYLEGIPSLRMRPDALDAAIEAALRSLGESSNEFSDSVIDELIARHPDLESAIVESASLTNSLLSASSLHREVRDISAGPLPRAFGAPSPDGSSRYELRRLLGTGASGQVFLAVDRLLSDADHEALVAIKLIPGMASDEQQRHALLDEALKMRRVDHPNVVRVLDAGYSRDESVFIVAEYVPGGSLDRLLKAEGGTLPRRRAVAITRRIALGLQAMHNAGVLHCDLKPSNIVLDASQEPKIVDFGIAVRIRESLPADAASGPIGNIAFMAPERFRSADEAVTVRGDLYSVGGILYHMLTGAVPNGATPKNARAYLSGSDPTSVESIRCELLTKVERDLAAICNRALDSDPQRRYETAAAFAEDLRFWLERRSIVWTRPSLQRRLRLWARRRPAIAVLSVFVVLACISALTFAYNAAMNAVDARVAKAENVAREELAKGLIELFTSVLKFQELGKEKTVLLPFLSVLESLYEERYMDIPGVEFVWDKRLAALRAIHARERVSRGPQDLRTLMWELALGTALYRVGDYREASEVLRANVAVWEALLGPADPWVADLKRVQLAVETVERLQRTPPDSDLSDRDIEWLSRAVEALRQVPHDAKGFSELTDIERIVLEALEELYGRAPFEDDQQLSRIRGILGLDEASAHHRPSRPPGEGAP